MTRTQSVKITCIDENTVNVHVEEYEPCYAPLRCKWCELGFKHVVRVSGR